MEKEKISNREAIERWAKYIIPAVFKAEDVLLQANRYRRDQHVPAIYRMPNPTELGKAIDFAGEFIKVFSNL